LTEDVSSPGGPQRVIRERESELSQLDALLEDARRSRGRVMLIQGAAGIGGRRRLPAGPTPIDGAPPTTQRG
jgi:hypothetical protein